MSRSNTLASLIIFAALLGTTLDADLGQFNPTASVLGAVELMAQIFGDRFEATTP